MSNEYFRRYAEIYGDELSKPWHKRDFDVSLDAYRARRDLVWQYSWAVPNEAALTAIAKLSPIVEVGAGGGYWAMLLCQHGAIVEPYDLYPYPLFNRQVDKAYIPVSKGGPERALRRHPHHTLFVCWPSLWDPWAAEALKLHQGEHVCYIGEGHGGCTADSEFHELLEERYEEIDCVHIPQWDGIHDTLTIWKRL